MSKDEAQARDGMRLGGEHWMGRLGFTNQYYAGRGNQERHGVDKDRNGGGDELHQDSGKARARYFRGRAAHGELAIAFQQVLAFHQRRQVTLISDVEEYR